MHEFIHQCKRGRISTILTTNTVDTRVELQFIFENDHIVEKIIEEKDYL